MGQLLDVGEFPHIFFLLRRCPPTRCCFPYAITLPSLDSSSSICGGPEHSSDPSYRCEWTDRTADLARELRPTTVR
jgi:hypothetical protein